MAYKLKWYLDLRKLDKDGRGRLYLAVYNQGSTGLIPTGVALMEGGCKWTCGEGISCR